MARLNGYRPCWLALLAVAGLLCTDAASTTAREAAPIPVEVVARQIERFAPGSGTRYGRLEFRGGLVLSSSFVEFGGLSGLSLDADGARFLAITDRGWWFAGRIVADGDRPTGLGEIVAAPMLGSNGQPLDRQGRADVEALTRTPEGYAVAIERRQEIWRFAGADPLLVRGRKQSGTAVLQQLGSNQGPEALLAVPLGTPPRPGLVVVGERSPAREDELPGYLFVQDRVDRFVISRSDEFDATDMALAPDGTVYLLERRYNWYSGVALRIRRFPLAALRPGARIDGEVMIEAHMGAQIDNMEALAIHRNAAGETLLTIISDDNFSASQRTLLLRFAVVEQP